MQNEEAKTLPTSDSEVGLLAKLYGWLRWIITNSIGTYIIYLALFEAKGWAENVVIFGAHIFLIIFFLHSAYIHENKSKKEIYIKRKVVPVKLDMVYDLIVSFFFAAHGWFYIAIIWFLQIIFESYVYSPDEKKAV